MTEKSPPTRLSYKIVTGRKDNRGAVLEATELVTTINGSSEFELYKFYPYPTSSTICSMVCDDASRYRYWSIDGVTVNIVPIGGSDVTGCVFSGWNYDVTASDPADARSLMNYTGASQDSLWYDGRHPLDTRMVRNTSNKFYTMPIGSKTAPAGTSVHEYVPAVFYLATEFARSGATDGDIAGLPAFNVYFTYRFRMAERNPRQAAIVGNDTVYNGRHHDGGTSSQNGMQYASGGNLAGGPGILLNILDFDPSNVVPYSDVLGTVSTMMQSQPNANLSPTWTVASNPSATATVSNFSGSVVPPYPNLSVAALRCNAPGNYLIRWVMQYYAPSADAFLAHTISNAGTLVSSCYDFNQTTSTCSTHPFTSQYVGPAVAPIGTPTTVTSPIQTNNLNGLGGALNTLYYQAYVTSCTTNTYFTFGLGATTAWAAIALSAGSAFSQQLTFTAVDLEYGRLEVTTPFTTGNFTAASPTVDTTLSSFRQEIADMRALLAQRSDSSDACSSSSSSSVPKPLPLARGKGRPRPLRTSPSTDQEYDFADEHEAALDLDRRIQ
jgi:hypothetical protein